MNPLLFIPSVREIPEVIESWNILPYDKYIVRMKLEAPAYQDGRDFFLSHPEYTHLVICPDDLVIDHDAFESLKRNVDEYNLSNLSGVSNLDEESPNVYCCKPLGVDISQVCQGSFYYTCNYSHVKPNSLLPTEIFQAGFSGFSTQFIERELMEKISFEGGCEEGKGCMDLKFAYELNDLEIPIMIDPNSFFVHLRNKYKTDVKAWKAKGSEFHVGYTLHLTDGQKYEID